MEFRAFPEGGKDLKPNDRVTDREVRPKDKKGGGVGKLTEVEVQREIDSVPAGHVPAVLNEGSPPTGPTAVVFSPSRANL